MKIWAKTKEFSEGKFLVVRRDGSVPHWPHFVLGARDPASSEALIRYADVCDELGMDPEFTKSVRELAVDFIVYRDSQGNGDPDAPPHRIDNPRVIAAMRHEPATISVRPDRSNVKKGDARTDAEKKPDYWNNHDFGLHGYERWCVRCHSRNPAALNWPNGPDPMWEDCAPPTVHSRRMSPAMADDTFPTALAEIEARLAAGKPRGLPWLTISTEVVEEMVRRVRDRDTWREAERGLSSAYVRLRTRIPGALDTPHAPSPETVWGVTEQALAALVDRAAAAEARAAELTAVEKALEELTTAADAHRKANQIVDDFIKTSEANGSRQYADLRAAIAEAIEGKWLPIYTAPKDGTLVDLSLSYPPSGKRRRVTDALWEQGGWRDDDNGDPLEWGPDQYGQSCVATHWRAAPPPPADAGER